MKKLALILLTLSTFTFADESSVICQKNDKDRANWVFLEDAKKKVADMGFTVKQAKMTSVGYCYEMLVVEKSTNTEFEIYFDPTTLHKVKVKEINPKQPNK